MGSVMTGVVMECRGIGARAGSFVLRDVSFTVEAGAHCVLTGPTAAGKTTLLELIAGAIAPFEGKLMIGGADVSSVAPEARGVGLVPQHGYLFPHLGVRENIGYGAHDTAIVSELARRFGADHLMDRSVASLSGGERQLVALCRALAPRPAVLLLDEPFSALDGKRHEAVIREFAELQTQWALTVLHVTHHEADATHATARLDMADGRVRSVV
jgi:ABC-type sugar transport system ATPase subunit